MKVSYDQLKENQIFSKKGIYLRLSDWPVKTTIRGTSKKKKKRYIGSKESLMLIECDKQNAYLYCEMNEKFYRPARVGEIFDLEDDDPEDPRNYVLSFFKNGQTKVSFLGDAQLIKDLNVSDNTLNFLFDSQMPC